jgi:hypothetical protein
MQAIPLPHPEPPRPHPLSGQVVPLEPVASPGELRRLSHEANPPWWTPSWADRARAIGWKWIFALPAVLVIGLLAGSWFRGELLIPLWFLGAKIILLCLAVPIVLLLEVVRSVTARRTDPFCIHCGYTLQGLPDDHTCPECGRRYNFRLVEEYRRDPRWFIQRYQAHDTHPMSSAPFHAGAVRSKRSRDGT